MAELPIDRCHELEHDDIQYGDGFVRRLTMKFGQVACNNGQRSAAAETSATNCLFGANVASRDHDDAVTALSVSHICQTNHESRGNAVLSTSPTTLPTATDSTTMLAGKFTQKCSASQTTQPTASNDLSECPVGTVANAKRLFEGLSPSVSSFRCRQSPAGSESKAITRPSTSDSEAISSGYSSLSAATSSSESTSPQTDNSDESNYNTVTPAPVDVTSDMPDTALSDTPCVALSHTNTSRHLSAAAASDSSSSSDDVSRDEVFLAVESNAASDTAKVDQLQTDRHIPPSSSTQDASPGCITYAVTEDEGQSNLLEKNRVEENEISSLKDVQGEAVTDDLPSKCEIISDNNINKTKMSNSEYDFSNVLSEIQVRGSINSTAAAPFDLSINEHREAQTDYNSEAHKSMCAEYIDDRSHFDINPLSLDCATSRRVSSRQLGTVQARHQATPVNRDRPMYCSIIHMGSQPDDVVIETVEDPPNGNRCYVTQSVSLIITEPRDQSATTVRSRRRVGRSRSDPGLIVQQIVVCGGAEYVGRARFADDLDESHSNTGHLMTSYTHLLTVPLIPITRRPKVGLFIDNTV